jgi:hypothetical protein
MPIVGIFDPGGLAAHSAADGGRGRAVPSMHGAYLSTVMTITCGPRDRVFP